MHFLYASDEGFSWVLKASIHSLLEHHRDADLTIHIVGQGLSEKTIDGVTEMIRSNGHQVEFIDMPDFEALLGKKIDPKQYTLSAFSRLFVDSLIDPEIERIIYLDCDTTVDADLSGLWNFDLGDAVVGAVNDCRNWRYVRHLGLPRDATYINSGVLLMDLKKFRADGWQQKFRDGIIRYDGLLEFPDNDLICMLMQDDLAILPPQYNMISPVRFFDYDQVRRFRRPSGYYTRAEYDSAKRKPTVSHFTTYFGARGRPWHQGYHEVDGREFRRHLDATGGSLLPPVALSPLRRLAVWAVNGPLSPIALPAFGLLHSFVKPNLSRGTRSQILARQSPDFSSECNTQ